MSSKAKTFAIVLMGTTALTPVRAEAAPVVAFFVSVAGAITAAFTAIGTAIGLSGTLLASFAAFGTKLVVGLSLLALSRLLTPKPRIPDPSERMVNFAQPITYMETVYGRVRKGGPIAYTNFSDQKRFTAVLLAAHRINGVVQHWLDEWQVATDGSGVVTTDPPGALAKINAYRGLPGQAADPELVAAFSEWTSSHNMAGLAYAVVRASKPAPENFSKNYPRGREWAYAPVIEGKDNIFDPRDNTYKYTNNAALVIADWIVNVMGRTVDWGMVAVEADASDVSVTNKQGTTQAKWTLNGVISDDQDDDVNRAQLGVACDAYFYEKPNGEIGFQVGRYVEPTVVLTEDSFYTATISEGDWGLNAPNEFVIQYVEPANAWRQAPSGAYIIDPTGRRTREEIGAWFINSHNQACRVAKRLARARRAQYKVAGLLKYVGTTLIGQRFVRIQHGELGLDFVAEVQKLVRGEDGLSYEIEAISVKPEDFDFVAAVEEPAQPAYGDAIKVVDDLTPTGISAVVETISGVPGVRVSWTPQNAALAHKVRWAVDGTSNWTVSDNIRVVSSFLVFPLEDGVTYKFQVQTTTGFSGGALTDWFPAVALTVTALANTTPPAALQAFAATLSAGDADVSFTAPNDPNYAATRIYRAAYAAGYGGPYDIADAVIVQTEYGAPNSADLWTDTTAPSGRVVYWGQPINASGIAGPTSGPEIVDIP